MRSQTMADGPKVMLLPSIQENADGAEKRRQLQSQEIGVIQIMIPRNSTETTNGT